MEKIVVHKKAFTLAEVLITLTILGVVAALVIPNMMQRYQEKVTVAKVKKTYHTLNNAIVQAQLENGPMETWDIDPYDNYEGALKIFNIVSPYLEVAKDCENITGQCFSPNQSKTLNGSNSWLGSMKRCKMFLLKDGTAVSLWSNGNNNCRAKNNFCIGFVFDINGPKSPNKVGIDLFGTADKHETGFPYTLRYKSSINLWCQKNDSSNNHNGHDCLYWILHKGNMDYLRRDITEELSKMAAN